MRYFPALVLGVMLLVSIALDRLWLALDHTVPTWDEAYHLNIALAYRETLAAGLRLGDGGWWAEMWGHAPMKPPLGNILAGAAMLWAGPHADAALWSFLPAILLLGLSVWWLGARLFGPVAGLWAAALVMVLPGLMPLRLGMLTDLHTVALTCAAFAALTAWHFARSRREVWLAALCMALALGLGLLSKPTIALFLLVPGLWAIMQGLRVRRWIDLGFLLASGVLAGAIAAPWHLYNLIFLVGGWRSSLVDAARAEGDPMPSTLAAWWVYPELLITQLGWPLLAMLLGGLVLYGVRTRAKSHPAPRTGPALRWLLLFVVAAYVLLTLVPNKDARFIAPWLPVLTVLAVGLSMQIAPGRGLVARAAVLGATALITLGLMFPLPPTQALARMLGGGQPVQFISDPAWPGTAVIETIGAAAPYQVSVLALVTASPTGNAHTLSFFGRQDRGPRVYAREIGQSARDFDYERLAYDWYLLDTADPRARSGLMGEMAQAVAQDPELSEVARWPGPRTHAGESTGEWVLMRRHMPRLEVAQDAATATAVKALDLPGTAQSGSTVALSYRLEGPVEALRDAVIVKQWHRPENPTIPVWTHAHPVAEGLLADGLSGGGVAITQRMSFLASAPAGRYRVQMALAGEDGVTMPLDHEASFITLVDAPASEPLSLSLAGSALDPNSRLALWSAMLAQGPGEFDTLFADVGRVNMAHPRQAYLDAARRNQGPGEHSLQIVLVCALQRDADCAARALQALLERHPDDALAWAYLSVIELYRRQAVPALAALDRADALGLDLPELLWLRAAALALDGQVAAAVRLLR